MATSPSIVELDDGRTLAYDVSGDPDGFPVVYHHAIGHSRLARHPEEGRTAGARVRLISVDRPGYGQSTGLRARVLRHWADDLGQLLDQLGIEQFSVLGWSGGAPFAVATAFAYPEAVQKVVLASPIRVLGERGATGQVHRGLRRRWRQRRLGPTLRIALINQTRKIRRNIKGYVDDMIATMGEDDQRILGDHLIRNMVERELAEAYAQAGEGIVEDLWSLSTWGFRLEDVTQPVHIFHGTDDDRVDIASARNLAGRFPTATLHELDSAGHWTMFERWHDVLGAAL